MFFFVWFFVPETKGKSPRTITNFTTANLHVSSHITGVSLEHMDELFGVTDTPKSVSGDAEDVPHQKSEVEVTETRLERQV